MRILFTTLPGIGHLHSIVPLAQSLRERGHNVAFACAPSFCKRVAAAGFSSSPAGLEWVESEAEQAFHELRALDPEKQSFWLLSNVFADISPHHMIPDLLTLCRAWKPHVIVRGEFEFAGCVVGECLGIPHAAVSLGLFFPTEIWKPLIGRKLDHLRCQQGLTPDPELAMLYRHACFAFLPPSYQFPNVALPASFHSLRPSIFDRSGPEDLPTWVYDLPRRPTVHATVGTTFTFATDVLEDIVRGLAGEPLNLIITTGYSKNLGHLDQLPSNVHVETYIPHTLLLPHCDVVITHGGASTTISSLFFGLPLVVIPLSNDHPFHAMRCAALGVGCVIKRSGHFEPYLFDRYYSGLSPKSIHDAVKEVLHNPSYRHSARRLREEMMALPGIENAVQILERLA